MLSMNTPPAALAALLALGDEVSLCHFRINALLSLLHGGGELAPSRRAVLRNVSEKPMTVPQIAALRPVSRQYVQKIVDALAGDGLVEFRPNPAHRRSKLVAITGAGRAALEAMFSLEAPLFERAAGAPDVSRERIETAVELLRTLRARMDELILELDRGEGLHAVGY